MFGDIPVKLTWLSMLDGIASGGKKKRLTLRQVAKKPALPALCFAIIYLIREMFLGQQVTHSSQKAIMEGSFFLLFYIQLPSSLGKKQIIKSFLTT